MLDDQIELVRLFNAGGIRYLVVAGMQSACTANREALKILTCGSPTIRKTD